MEKCDDEMHFSQCSNSLLTPYNHRNKVDNENDDNDSKVLDWENSYFQSGPGKSSEKPYHSCKLSKNLCKDICELFLNNLKLCLIFFLIALSVSAMITLTLEAKPVITKNDKPVECRLPTQTTKNHYEHLLQSESHLLDSCSILSDSGKFDCIPQGDLNEHDCNMRGCCWSQNKSSGGPQCYYPKKYISYKFRNSSSSDLGTVAYYQLAFNSSYPGDILLVKVDFNYLTEDILEVKIYDPTQPRYEPPYPVLPPVGSKAVKDAKCKVDFDTETFGFRVIRKSNNQAIFVAQDVGAFIFSDQLLQLSAGLPSNQVYGLGQQRNNLLLSFNWSKITLFNHDEPPKDKTNLYGSHPFYLAMEDGGLSNGVLLLNSNAMDIILQPLPAITYRTIGGIFDFYFFLGPSPADVLRQYTQLIGRPFMPPYWSLGFHLCRFGYKTLEETKMVWNRTRSAGIPFDTQWNDLDYMQDGNDFTYDTERFKGLPEFVDQLHKDGMHYIVLIDPGVSAGELPGTYLPYDQGIAQRVFVSDIAGFSPFVGKVWNKESTVWVDFLKPEAVNYWIQQLRSLQKMFSFDGAWIDMNDPSNFLNGTKVGCPNTTLDYPPYVPGVSGGMLSYRTLCMSAKHNKNVTHYNVHNIYGLAEALVTRFAMQQIRNKRAFVISRSSFPGHGKYAGVWTGDIFSSWEDMAHSVSDILSFSLFGIPMSGADICGFNDNTTAALCTRWSQLGAFYPFSRNHNSDQSSDQDPVALGPQVVQAARSALLIRYSLLPYLYTLFWRAHSLGDTVVRPMFVEFPDDNKTYTIKSQFLWGPGLLIAPVLEEGAVSTQVYLPRGRWYDYYTSRLVEGCDSWETVPAPMDAIPLFWRGGFVIPTQHPSLTTTQTRSNPLKLVVALCDKGQASGDFYWDDGDSLDHNDGVYNLLQFTVANNKLKSNVQQWNYKNETLLLDSVKVLGVDLPVTSVTVNDTDVSFVYNIDTKILEVTGLNVDVSEDLEMVWK